MRCPGVAGRSRLQLAVMASVGVAHPVAGDCARGMDSQLCDRTANAGSRSTRSRYDSSRFWRSSPIYVAVDRASRRGAGKVRTTQTAGGHHRLSEAEIDRLLARHTPSARTSSHATRRPAGLILALSGRNRLRGFVEEVRIDGLLGQVRLRIGDQTLTAVITSDALTELKLRRGDDALAIVKSTEVMIAREAEEPTVPTRRRRARR